LALLSSLDYLLDLSQNHKTLCRGSRPPPPTWLLPWSALEHQGTSHVKWSLELHFGSV
jgi:hypothetical protein